MSHHVGFKLGTKAVLLCHSIFSEIMVCLFFLYLDISSSWPCTLWSQRPQGRVCQRTTGTAWPALCGSPGPAWSHRFYQISSRGSTRSIHPPHSALTGGNWQKGKYKDNKYFAKFWHGVTRFFKMGIYQTFFFNISTLTLDWPCGMHSMSLSLGS